jgi:hypothetical protein
MGSVSVVYDSAMAESLFSTFESELLTRRFRSQAEADLQVRAGGDAPIR